MHDDDDDVCSMCGDAHDQMLRANLKNPIYFIITINNYQSMKDDPAPIPNRTRIREAKMQEFSLSLMMTDQQ